MTDIYGNIKGCAVTLFRVKISEVSNSASRKSFAQVTESFNLFMSGTPVRLSDFNENLVSEWVSWLFCNGYTYKTVVYYVNRLSSLYGKVAGDGLTEGREGFSAVKEKLKKASAISLEINSITDCFGRLRRMVLTDCSTNSARQLAKDLVLFSLYNGGLSFRRLAGYRKDDYQGSDEAVMAIVERYSKAKNKYLFPLNQSERTPNQLESAISSLFSDALRSAGIKLSSYGGSIPVDLWVRTAMNCGIPAADIAGCVEQTDSVNPVCSFAVRNELTAGRIAEIRSRVARILSRNPEDWYAMQFRPHVTYERVQERLMNTGISFTGSFYPMEEIVRRVGKKLKRESRPVIPGLLFFKSRATELPALFFHIGDLAWGYRYDRNARGPYAVIPQKAIEDYERAVGQFVESMDAYPEGTFHFEPGDKVEITGGDFRGQPAIFEKEVRELGDGPHAARRISYRLKLAGTANFSWVVELDPRQMAKITDERFAALSKTNRSAV